MNTAVAKHPSVFWRTFRAPLAIAAVTLVGLISALVGDGVWDALSWAALALPLAVIAFYWLRAGR